MGSLTRLETPCTRFIPLRTYCKRTNCFRGKSKPFRICKFRTPAKYVLIECRSWSKDLANVEGFPVESDLPMEPAVEMLSSENEIWNQKCHFTSCNMLGFEVKVVLKCQKCKFTH